MLNLYYLSLSPTCRVRVTSHHADGENGGSGRLQNWLSSHKQWRLSQEPDAGKIPPMGPHQSPSGGDWLLWLHLPAGLSTAVSSTHSQPSLDSGTQSHHIPSTWSPGQTHVLSTQWCTPPTAAQQRWWHQPDGVAQLLPMGTRGGNYQVSQSMLGPMECAGSSGPMSQLRGEPTSAPRAADTHPVPRVGRLLEEQGVTEQTLCPCWLSALTSKTTKLSFVC